MNPASWVQNRREVHPSLNLSGDWEQPTRTWNSPLRCLATGRQANRAQCQRWSIAVPGPSGVPLARNSFELQPPNPGVHSGDRRPSHLDGVRGKGKLSHPFITTRMWRNWQTRWLQVPVRVTEWRFESSHPQVKQAKAVRVILTAFLHTNITPKKASVCTKCAWYRDPSYRGCDPTGALMAHSALPLEGFSSVKKSATSHPVPPIDNSYFDPRRGSSGQCRAPTTRGYREARYLLSTWRVWHISTCSGDP